MAGIYYKTALLLIFFGHGIIYSVILTVRFLKTKEISQQWLAILIFLATLYITPWMLGHAGWYAKDGYREFLFFVPFHQLFLIGPIVYFYVQSLIRSAFKLERRDYLHFVPAGLYLIYSLMVFIADFWILDEFYFYSDYRDKDLSPWYQITGTFSMLSYTVLSYKNYLSYKSRILDEVSFADSIKFNWLKRFLLALALILSLRVIFMIALPNWGDFGLKWWYYVSFACIFYYITFAGYTNSIWTSLAYQLPSLAPVPEADTKTKEMISIEVDEWKKKINRYVIDQRAYKNPRLTLQDLANHLETNPRTISQSINQGFNMNFNDYVNEARLTEVKARMDQGDHLRYTLLSIALDCGFNSKSTFNRVFKFQTNMTPNTYLKMLEDIGAKS